MLIPIHPSGIPLVTLGMVFHTLVRPNLAGERSGQDCASMEFSISNDIGRFSRRPRYDFLQVLCHVLRLTAREWREEAVIAQVNQVHDRKWHQPRISWAVAADEYDRWRLPPGFRLILHRGSDQRRMSRCMKSPTFIYQNCMENPSPRGLPESRLTSKTFNLSCVKPEPVCGVPLAKRFHIMLELFRFERESLVPCEK